MEQDPVGLSWLWIPSMSPVSCLKEIGFIQPPWPFLSSKVQTQTVAYQGREEMQKERRSSQETLVQINKIVYTNFFRFHVYALIYDICFSLSDLLHSVWQSLGPSMSLQNLQSRNRDTDVEIKHMDAKGQGGAWDELGDWDWHIYTIDTMYKIDN